MRMEEKILCATIILVFAGATASAVTMGDALASINGSYDIVWAYNASSGAWLRYVPGSGGNTLTEASVVQGYWVKMNSADTLNISGTEPSSTDMSMAVGWNLIGYPKTTEAAVGTSLASINNKYLIVWAYNASSGGWLRYVPGSGGNTLTNMLPGFGYWIKMNETGTLTIS